MDRRRLVLLGAGHTHALALARIAESAKTCGWDVVLACGEAHVPYSGMIPGAIAGLYRRRQIFIDIPALAASSGMRLVASHAVRLNAFQRTIELDDGSYLQYDLLSINVGGTIVPSLAGDASRICPVKPVAAFLDWLEALEPDPGRTIAVIGAGVAGSEVAMTLDSRLRRAGRRGGVFLVGAEEELMPGYPAFAAAVAKRLARRGISQLLGSPAAALDQRRLTLANGMSAPATEAVVATGVSTWPGLGTSGLATDAAGFVAVNRRLQSISHPEVFAAGDCISWTSGTLRRAGVYAVRQAPALAANLSAAMSGASLVDWRGEGSALAIVCEGDGTALAHRPLEFARGREMGRLLLHGRLVWHWKDWLDRRFMRRLGVPA